MWGQSKSGNGEGEVARSQQKHQMSPQQNFSTKTRIRTKEKIVCCVALWFGEFIGPIDLASVCLAWCSSSPALLHMSIRWKKERGRSSDVGEALRRLLCAPARDMMGPPSQAIARVPLPTPRRSPGVVVGRIDPRSIDGSEWPKALVSGSTCISSRISSDDAATPHSSLGDEG